MLSKYKTEQVGISAEVAVADLCNVEVAPDYRRRARVELVEHISPSLALPLSRIPRPTEHIAEKQNPIDFKLETGLTLSVKSNMRSMGKNAPQNIGQPTAATFWSLLPNLVPRGESPEDWSSQRSRREFKKVAFERTEELLTAYWRNYFECDYMIYVWNVLEAKTESLSSSVKSALFAREDCPQWERSLISFTADLDTWNESSTIKYSGHSIGEFQVHNNRNCLKFRFNLQGLHDAGLLFDRS